MGCSNPNTLIEQAMANLILVSNRLSVSVEKKKGKLEFKASMGGLATGLSSLDQKDEMLWIGWPGLPADELAREDTREIASVLRQKYNSIITAGTEQFPFLLRFLQQYNLAPVSLLPQLCDLRQLPLGILPAGQLHLPGKGAGSGGWG